MGTDEDNITKALMRNGGTGVCRNRNKDKIIELINLLILSIIEKLLIKREERTVDTYYDVDPEITIDSLDKWVNSRFEKGYSFGTIHKGTVCYY